MSRLNAHSAEEGNQMTGGGGRKWFGLREQEVWNVKERQIICESFRRVKQVGIRSEWSRRKNLMWKSGKQK